MSLVEKYRTRVYDTPATYTQFNGGINTNLSNEDLEPNELRDGLNCHYVNQSLMNRKGEKITNKLLLPINTRAQGDFLFSAEHNDYIICIRNGRIYWNIYNPEEKEIRMNLLPLDYTIPTNDGRPLADGYTNYLRDDCENWGIDLKWRTTRHDPDSPEDTEGYILKYVGDGTVEPDYTPSDREASNTLICQNTRRVQAVPVKLNMNPNDSVEIPYRNEEHTYLIMATGTRILRIEETQYVKTHDEVFDANKMYFYWDYRKQAYIMLQARSSDNPSRPYDYESESTFTIFAQTAGDSIKDYVSENHHQVYRIQSTFDEEFQEDITYYKIIGGVYTTLVEGTDYEIGDSIASWEENNGCKVYDTNVPEYIKPNEEEFTEDDTYVYSNGTLVDYFEETKRFIPLTANVDYTVGSSIKKYESKTRKILYKIVSGDYFKPDESTFQEGVVYCWKWGPKVYEYLGNEDYTLVSHILEAYKPNSWEKQNIGVNNLSPYPNYWLDESKNTPKTLIGDIAIEPKQIAYNVPYIVASVKVNCLVNWAKSDMYYKWEARFGKDSDWKTVHFWRGANNQALLGKSEAEASSKNKISIKLTNADLQRLNEGRPISVDDELFIRCTLTSDFQYTYNLSEDTYSLEYGEPEFYVDATSGNITQTHDTDDPEHPERCNLDYIADESIAQYSKTFVSRVIRSRYAPNDMTEGPDQPDYWDANGQRLLTIGEHDAPADRQFLRMHSCVKIVSDGTKIILYDDMYDSCEWYKSVVGQPNYISYGGNLNFKTTKDEHLVGVVIFDSAIVAFSDNDKLGGNISVVTGNGDDYNDGDYYSPYKRKIVNTHVSCDAYNSIQVFENNIIFKYRDDIYALDTNDLNNDKVEVVTINDKVKTKLNIVEFPLNRIRLPYDSEKANMYEDFYQYNRCLKPDEIFSEIYDGYYGIIFPHQASHQDTFEYPEGALVDYQGDNEEYINKLHGNKLESIQLKPGLRWKCYLRNGQVYNNNPKVFYPWLRDVSHYLNIVGQLVINGISTLVTENGELVQFNNDDYDGLDEYNYRVRIVTKCYDMETPALCKFMDNLNVYYNRDFLEKFYCDMYVKNEAGFYIYTPNDEAYISMQEQPVGEVKYDERYTVDDALNMKGDYLPLDKYDEVPYVDPIDKPVQVLNDTPLGDTVLDRPSFTSKTLTPKYRFPFLSAQFIMEIRSNQAFALSSLQFSFTSHDMPDFTREKLYRDILKGSILQ